MRRKSLKSKRCAASLSEPARGLGDTERSNENIKLAKEPLTIEPKLGTIVPIMGTKMKTLRIAAGLFGKVRQGVLALFYGRPEQSLYLREIVRAVGLGQGAVQRELARLTAAGLLVRTRKGNQVYYQANRESPVFGELKSLLVKTAGIADVLRNALAPLAEQIKVGFIYGSFANGEEKAESDIDLMVIGNVRFKEVTANLKKAHESLGREVNATVYPVSELREKIHARHHFLYSVLKSPKIFLLGDEFVLRRLAAKRLAR